MQDYRQRYHPDNERREPREWRGREEHSAEGSWRDQGDGGYFEPSRGRWDDDRRYRRSRQDQYEDRGRYDASLAVGDQHDASFDDRGYGRQREWSGSLHGFGGSYGRGAGRYSELDRGYRAFDRAADEPWSNDRSHGWNRWNRQAGSSMDMNEPSYAGQPDYAGRGPKDYRRSDERIREEVSDRLTDDHRVDASDIVVEVRSCEVTLSGTVSDRDQKRRAEALAEHVSGVREVSNHLRVSRSDEDRASGREQASGGTTSGNKPKSGSRLP